MPDVAPDDAAVSEKPHFREDKGSLERVVRPHEQSRDCHPLTIIIRDREVLQHIKTKSIKVVSIGKPKLVIGNFPHGSSEASSEHKSVRCK